MKQHYRYRQRKKRSLIIKIVDSPLWRYDWGIILLNIYVYIYVIVIVIIDILVIYSVVEALLTGLCHESTVFRV